MLYPIFLDVRDKKCVVIGGGRVAARKARMLCDCGARVVVVSPELEDRLAEMLEKGEVEWRERAYEKSLLQGAFVVVAATDDEHVNRSASADCRQAGIPINVVDVPELCDFHVPSIVRSGDVTVSIGSGGASPALSRHIRKRIEQVVGPEYGKLLDLLGRWRDRVKEQVSGLDRRKALWERAIASDALNLLADGRDQEAEELIRQIIEQEISGA